MKNLPVNYLAPFYWILQATGEEGLYLFAEVDPIHRESGYIFGKLIRYQRASPDTPTLGTILFGDEEVHVALCSFQDSEDLTDLSADDDCPVYETDGNGDFKFTTVSREPESFYSGPGRKRTAVPSIETNIPSGVVVTHFRVWDGDWKSGDPAHDLYKYDDIGLSAKGGSTAVLRLAPVPGNTTTFRVDFGLSICSYKDNFHRKLGINYALARLNSLEEPQKEKEPEEFAVENVLVRVFNRTCGFAHVELKADDYFEKDGAILFKGSAHGLIREFAAIFFGAVISLHVAEFGAILASKEDYIQSHGYKPKEKVLERILDLILNTTAPVISSIPIPSQEVQEAQEVLEVTGTLASEAKAA